MIGKLFGHFGKKTHIEHHRDRTVISNYGHYKIGRLNKRALICFLTAPVIADLAGEETIRFSNSGIALSWVRVLNEMGYILDIVEWNDTEFIPKETYDLVIFHGGHNFARISKHLSGQPKIIHFSTGSYWKFNNDKENQRRIDFEKRHGGKLPPDRHIDASEDEVNEMADGIILIGSPSIRDTYPSRYKQKPILTLNIASYPDSHFDKTKKNYATARKNFLFFAGSGNIHKGLDLLIDAFQDLDEHLYIVTVLDKPVMKALKQELARPNIHLIGEVPMRTPQFYEIVDQCAFVILPSCSEGQPGSVVECMNQGLIPIVSKESRLDASKYGRILQTNTVPEIKKKIRSLSGLPAEAVEAMANTTRQVTMGNHSPEIFRKQLRNAITSILG